MSRSWKIFVEAVDALHKPQFRLGDDFADTKLAKLASGIPGVGLITGNVSKARTESGEDSDLLGEFVVQVKVGDIAKSTSPFQVSGSLGAASAEVQQYVVVPAPVAGETLTVCVSRHHHLQQNAVVGEAVFTGPLGSTTNVELFRGKGKVKGLVKLRVDEIHEEQDAVVVKSEGKGDGLAKQALHVGYGLAHVAGGLAKQMLPENVADAIHVPGGFRRPLRQRAKDEPTIGEVTVHIKSVSEISKKMVGKVALIVNVEDQECLASNLDKKTEDELTFKFLFGHLISNVRIYCYDENALNQNDAVGRILLPLQEFLWRAGEPLSYQTICDMFKPLQPMSKTYTATFMPVRWAGGSGDGFEKDVWRDRFQPFSKRVRSSGLPKSGAFGKVILRVDVNFHNPQCQIFANNWLHKLSMTPLGVYTDITASSYERLKNAGQLSLDAAASVDEKEIGYTDFIAYLRSASVKRIFRNMNRLEDLLNGAGAVHNFPFVRFLRAEPWRGPLAAVLWLLFCVLGFFPPSLWLVPVYLWALLASLCLIDGEQRALDWSNMSDPYYHTWREEGSVFQAKASTSDKLRGFMNSIDKLSHVLEVFTSYIERFKNLFVFGDGNASVLCFLTLFFGACACSGVLWILGKADPGHSYTSGGIGFIVIVMLSKKRQVADVEYHNFVEERKANKDPLRKVNAFNQILECVPDDTELAHRYIATRVQCEGSLRRADLTVTIISASSLRNADTGLIDRLMAQDKSDPYCTCRVPGKPNTEIKTKVIDNELNPEWNHTGEIEDFVIGESLHFEVWDHDIVGDHDFLGRAVLPSKSFYPKGFDSGLKLVEAGKKKKDKATLRVKVVVKERSEQSVSTEEFSSKDR